MMYLHTNVLTSEVRCDAVLHMTTSMHQHLTFPVRFLLGLHRFVWVQQFPRIISFALRLQTNPSCRTLGICMRHIRGVKNTHRHDPLCMQLHVVHYWPCTGFLLGGRPPPPPPPPPENVFLEISNPDPPKWCTAAHYSIAPTPKLSPCSILPPPPPPPPPLASIQCCAHMIYKSA